ncbi:hypothetical protein [Saccharothrix obliqua]|uniref:hypothetical protein n=1 Tax=Saccharothrix obliqua TaxID=2861747 RepID=UPI001C5FFBAE|nr:hypothetical protein [Saccharothrix obliqua]MBW4716905.1 hypothetical protein [Saccharothrix obliqua]
MRSLVAALDEGLFGPVFEPVVHAVDRLLSRADVFDPAEDPPGIRVLFDEVVDRHPAVRLVHVALLAALRPRGSQLELCALGDHDNQWRPPGLWLPMGKRKPGVPLADQIDERTEEWFGQETWFVTDTALPRRRVVVVERGDRDGVVRVAVNGVAAEVPTPPAEVCERLLSGGDMPTRLRFPMFPGVSGTLIARGDEPDELVLLHVGDRAVRHVLPGPVLAALHVRVPWAESLIAVIQDGDRLRVHVEGTPYYDLHEAVVPADFDVARFSTTDLSPARLHHPSPEHEVNFRGPGGWWKMTYLAELKGKDFDLPAINTLKRIEVVTDAPGLRDVDSRYGAKRVALGPDLSSAGAPDGLTWNIHDHACDEEITITTRPHEEVLGLMKPDEIHTLVLRDGDRVIARTRDTSRTVVETDRPVALHLARSWLAVQRSPQLIEVVEVPSGRVVDQLRARS